MSYNAASNITHCQPTFFTAVTSFDAHCTVHCTAGDLNAKLCESRRKVSTIPNCTVCMRLTWCEACNVLEVRLGPAVQCGDIMNCVCLSLCEAKFARNAVLLGVIMTSHKPGWHLPIRSTLLVSALGTFSYVWAKRWVRNLCLRLLGK